MMSLPSDPDPPSSSASASAAGPILGEGLAARKSEVEEECWPLPPAWRGKSCREVGGFLPAAAPPMAPGLGMPLPPAAEPRLLRPSVRLDGREPASLLKIKVKGNAKENRETMLLF